MTDPPHSTMAASEAAAPSRAQQQASTTSSHLPTPSAPKSFVTRAYDLAIRAYFPTPSDSTKFNPITAMNQLLRTMLKDESSLVLRNDKNDKQVILATTSLPTGKSEFQQYFTVSTSRIATKNQSNVCIGCNVLSDRSLGQIKFQSKDNNFLAWLKQACIFIESDSLGIERPVTIGYLTKIDPDITNLALFRDHLANQLLLIDVDEETAIALAPYLKQTKLDAMTNGDDYVPILPTFELYQTRLSHGRDPSKVTTDVIGIKGAPKDAKLLGEFFTRFAAETNNDHRDGRFLPKGAATLLGSTTYERVLKEHNFFLTQVATVPVNLEYNAWFAVIDPTDATEDAPISLHDHLLRQPWFLRIESATRNKCLVVTTRPNLQTARDWIDANLEPMVRKSIPPGIDPPSALLPRRLDKPVYTATSQTYADILKRQFSLDSPTTALDTANTRPPRKRPATIIDYDSDESTTPTDTKVNEKHSIAQTNERNSKPIMSNTTATDYAKELLFLKSEIASLKQTIATAVEQIMSAIKVIHAPPHKPETTAMETDHETVSAEDNLHLPLLISDLKHEIVTMIIETRALFQQQTLNMTNTNRLPSKT